MTHEPFVLPFDQAACIYALAQGVVYRMQTADPPVDERKDHAPMPRGVLSCGEAWAIIPLVLILLVEKFPALRDEEVVEDAIRTAVLPSQTIQ